MKRYLCFLCLVLGFLTFNFNIVKSQCNPPSGLTATPDPVCLGNSVNLNGTSSLGLINWYTSAAGSTLVGSTPSGSNFTVTPTSIGTVTYYASAIAPGSASTQTGYNTNNSHAGIMFDLEAKACVLNVTGINGQVASGKWSAEVYYRTSTCQLPAALTSSGWIYLGCVNITGNGSGVPTTINFPSPVIIPAYQRYAICVLTQSTFYYENGSSFGTVLYSNPDLILYEGYGPKEYSNCSAGFNQTSINNPRRFRGEIFYTTSCGCESSRVPISFEVTPPITDLTISPDPAFIVCDPASTTLTANPIGGNGNFTYNWSGGNPTNQQSTTVSSAATYTVTATSGGCNKIASKVVTNNNTPPTINISPSSGVLTCSQPNISVTASGGGTYEWSGGLGMSATVNINVADTYTVTVTSPTTGCSATQSITITYDNNVPIVNITPSSGVLTCSETTISVTASGGDSYEWSHSLGTNATATINTPGVYTVTATNSTNGCTDTKSITITQNIIPPTAHISASANTLNCAITSIALTASGGDSYQWSGGQGTSSIINVSSPDTYTVTVTNQTNGCIASASQVINQAPPLEVTHIQGNIACYGGTTTVSVYAKGGTPPYSGDNTFILPAGTHNYTVTDNGGCSENTGAINIPQPPLLVASATITQDILCYGEAATVLVSASGGTAPYKYIGEFIEYAGNTSYTVIDTNGCSATTHINIPEPTQLIATAVVATPIKCFGEIGKIQVSAQGGTKPYSGTGNFNVIAGTYSYFVTDKNACEANTDQLILAQAQPLGIDIIMQQDVTCFGRSDGKILIAGTNGVEPYNYFITNENKTTHSNINNNLRAGECKINIIDKNNCSKDTIIIINVKEEITSVPLVSNPTCITGKNGIIDLNINGGKEPYSIFVNEMFYNYNTILDFLDQGVYNIRFKDANGCEIIVPQIKLIDKDVECLIIPNAITPNGDEVNDVWIIDGIENFYNYEVAVFNRWGQQVFYSTNYEKPWDGKYKNKLVSAGTYLYVISRFGDKKKYSGTITVIY